MDIKNNKYSSYKTIYVSNGQNLPSVFRDSVIMQNLTEFFTMFKAWLFGFLHLDLIFMWMDNMEFT